MILKRIVSNLEGATSFAWPFSSSGDPLPVPAPHQSLLWALEYAAEECVYNAWGRDRVVSPQWLKKLTISKQSLPSVELDPPDVQVRLLHHEAAAILRSRLEVVVSYLTSVPLPHSLQDESGGSSTAIETLDAARGQLGPFLTPSDAPRFLRWYAQERGRLASEIKRTARDRDRDREKFLKSAGLNRNSTVADVLPADSNEAILQIIQKLTLKKNECGVCALRGVLTQY